MLQTFTATLNPMLMLFSCILIGFILKRFNLMPENTGTVLSKLETLLLVPAVSFSAFSKYCTISSLKENGSLVLYACLAVACSIAIAIGLSYVFPLKDAYSRNIYRYALAYANYGFVGNAIVPIILGSEEYLYYYLLFTLSLSFTVYLWGVSILIPKEHKTGSPWKRIINMPLISLFAGALVGLSGIGTQLPGFVVNTVNALKGCMGPIAMVLCGFVIAEYPLKSLLSDRRVYAAAILRLFILPTVIMVILYVCGARENILVYALFAFATPLGMNTVVFPAAYGGEPKTGAGMALISSTLSVISIPIMYSLFLEIMKIL